MIPSANNVRTKLLPAYSRYSKIQDLPNRDPLYDLQLGMSLTENLTKLSYNITTTSQENTSIIRTAYLLNGLTDIGYWFQFGLAWNWNGSNGFSTVYEIWSPNGTSISPGDGFPVMGNFDLKISEGDTINISISIYSNNILIKANDLDSGATFAIILPSFGSKLFVGMKNSAFNSKGYFTGLMTEFFSSNGLFGKTNPVFYYNQQKSVSLAWVWEELYDCSVVCNAVSIYSEDRPVSLSPAAHVLSKFITDIPVYFSSYFFGSGNLDSSREALVSVSYQLREQILPNCCNNLTLPNFNFTFFSFGHKFTVTLDTEVRFYLADVGTTWFVTKEVLIGQYERYITNETSEGLIFRGFSWTFNYFHQYLFSFYFFTNGPIMNKAPLVNFSSFGKIIQRAANFTEWVDSRTLIAYQQLIPGYDNETRFYSGDVFSGVYGPGQLIVKYYYQLKVRFLYNFLNGTPSSIPKIGYLFHGITFYALPNTSVWADYLSPIIYPKILASTLHERWTALQGNLERVIAPGNITLRYIHQYYVEINASNGGSVSFNSGWFNPFTVIVVTAIPSKGWEFSSWNGTLHSLNQTLIINVTQSENISANFSPGVNIAVLGYGYVDYLTPNWEGRVFTNLTIYPPYGKLIRLEAVPLSPFFIFKGWKYDYQTSSGTLFIKADKILNIEADFEPNYTLIALLFLTVILIVSFFFWKVHYRKIENISR